MKTIEWNGKQITKPGLYSRVPLNSYHSADICDGPSVSSSGLRRIFNESPAHFFCDWSGNPGRVEPDDKPHFVIGRAVHHLLLGEPFFAKLFAIQPPTYVADRGPDEGKTKPWANGADVCKRWHAEIAKAGRAVLTGKDVENIRGMAAKLGQHPIIRAGALNGQIERSMFWRDKDTGIWLKSRPDSIPGDSGDFVDLKTTTSVKWIDLQRTIAELAYHQQGALVREGARKILGIDTRSKTYKEEDNPILQTFMPNFSFSLVFIEKKNPWCTRVVALKDNDLDRGEQANRAALDAMARCLKSGHWPGPGGDREDAEHIELPIFAQNQIDDRLKYGIAT